LLSFSQLFPSCPSSNMQKPDLPYQYHCQTDPNHILYGHSLPPSVVSNDLTSSSLSRQLSASRWDTTSASLR
jgi:hypothetical protein